jgi:hypothetical protein
MDLAATSADWNKILGIANIIIAGGTIVLAFVAIFGRAFSRWYRRPKLEIIVDSSPPQCRKTYLSDRSGTNVAGGGPLRLDSLMGGISSESVVDFFLKHQAASANG